MAEKASATSVSEVNDNVTAPFSVLCTSWAAPALSATGNPQAKNLFEIVAHLQKIEGTKLQIVDQVA